MDVNAAPKAVRSFARYVQKTIGEEPQIEQIAPLTWRIALTGKRITASADFRSALGKTKYVGGALVVDGESRPAVGWPELRILWDQHERPASDRASLDPMPPLPADARMPAEVRQLHDQLDSALAGKAPVMAGYDGRWVIGVDGPDGDGVRFTFERTAHGGHWTLAGKRPIQIIAAGNDLSAEVGRDAAKAMAALTQGFPGTGDAVKGPGPKPSHGARDNGIEFRKGNVIRV